MSPLCYPCQINLVIVGPEQPLVDGITDLFTANGIPCFGPSKAGAIIEGSKAFSKEFMERHAIPTARFKVGMPRSSVEIALHACFRIEVISSP
jgi:phosphoribosylamine-glycine ligase